MDKLHRWQRHQFYRNLPFIVSSVALQACVTSGQVGAPIGPGTAPSMNPPFDTYDVCIRNISPAPFWDVSEIKASQQDCFERTIQVHHLALRAGTTPEQAFAKYEDCLKKNAPVSIGVAGFLINGNKQNTARQACFTSALQ